MKAGLAIFLLGTLTSMSAFAACPFGADCKAPPCSAEPETAATASTGSVYAPRFKPMYGTSGNASYQPANQAGTVYSAHVYGLPPCDPDAPVPENKPVIPVIPVEKPPEEKEDETGTDDISEQSGG